MTHKKTKTCSQGHTFQKSSDCPVCPMCWSGDNRKEFQSDFPEKLGAPALRALLNAGIKNMKDLTKYTEAEILDLHGMGPKALEKLKSALEEQGLAFIKRKD